MPRKWFKRYLPAPHTIKEHQHLQIFGELLHNPNLWHLNRQSVSLAFSIGLFVAFIPLPLQMLIAAAAAIIFHANLPLSVSLVWVTNPVTMPAIFFFAYKVGAKILGVTPQPFNFEISLNWLLYKLTAIWQPFLLGCFICGIVAAVASNAIIRLIWRISVARNWHIRKNRRQNNGS